jgi:hypothetical protein
VLGVGRSGTKDLGSGARTTLLVEPQQAFRSVREALSARQVFGEPVERDGVTVIPAATVIGGGGGGGGIRGPGGDDASGGEPTTGAGMGFALVSWASGAFEIREGRVAWRPTLDITRILLAAQGVGLVLGVAILTVLGRPSRSRLARKRKRLRR